MCSCSFLHRIVCAGAERQLLFQKNKGNAPVTKPGGDSAHIRHIPAKGDRWNEPEAYHRA